MSELTILYQCLQQLDNKINIVISSMEVETASIHTLEDVIQNTQMKKINKNMLNILINWHKSRVIELRKSLREYYIYRDVITDDIQYYNMYPS